MVKKTINQTENGHVFMCTACNMIHFEYKNININFKDEKEYLHFVNYILKLDGDYWETLNKGIHFRRKIIVPSGFPPINVLFDREELQELKDLLEGKHHQPERKLNASVEYFFDN